MGSLRESSCNREGSGESESKFMQQGGEWGV